MSMAFVMPALSPTMEKGTLARWLVAVGDAVGPGDVLAEVETDKATLEVEADEGGVVEALLVDAGAEDVPVGTAIARIAAVGAQPGLESARPPAAPPPLQPAPPQALAGEVAAPSDPALPPTASPPAARPAQSAAGKDASPLAARVASARGLDLAGIVGSGPGGRVRLADLAPPPAPAEPDLAPVGPGSTTPHRTLRLSPMRRTLARRLSEAKRTVPHFYLTSHLRVDALLALREELNGKLQSRGVKLSVNDFLLKALALAIARTPEVNVQYAGDILLQFERVDVSMAVAIPGGFVTPVLRDAAGRSLSFLSAEARTLAARARDGRLAPEEYEGGTASISNLGMFGIDEFVPVINPPQTLILGLGAVLERVLPRDGRPEIAPVLTVTGGFDHRAIDGAAAAHFMAALRALVEQPFGLVVQ